eukprot:759638-Hanusia_phi.AAC.2
MYSLVGNDGAGAGSRWMHLCGEDVRSISRRRSSVLVGGEPDASEPAQRAVRQRYRHPHSAQGYAGASSRRRSGQAAVAWELLSTSLTFAQGWDSLAAQRHGKPGGADQPDLVCVPVDVLLSSHPDLGELN